MRAKYNKEICTWLEELKAAYNPGFDGRADTYFFFKNQNTYFICIYFDDQFVVRKQLGHTIIFESRKLPETKEILIYILKGLEII